MDNASQLANHNKQLVEECGAAVQKLAAQEIQWARDQATLRQLLLDHTKAQRKLF